MRPGSGQEVDGDRKRCYRHQEIHPDESPWRVFDEFWSKQGVSSGLQSRCKRCIKKIKNSTTASDPVTRSRVPVDESAEIHARVHEETKAMIDVIRDRQQRSLSAIVNDACKQYALRQMLKERVA